MRRPSPSRSGSIYVVVLGAAMIVATIALAASSIGRLALRNASSERDRLQAQAAARSGVEFALVWINQHPAWRTQLTSGVESADLTANKVRFTWSVTDEDGNLNDDALEHAVIRAIGKSGAARSALQVTVEPSATGLSCLDSALHANGEVILSAGATIQRNGAVTSNYGPSPYLASPTKTMPGADVLDYYVTRGTWIPIGSFPGSSTRSLTNLVLSRRINPFGETNPWGVYVIDCQGANLDMSFCRVYGTLVLLNAGTGTAVSDVAIFQPEAANYPSLIVQGNLGIDLKNASTAAELREPGRVNYNPIGAPYNAVEDSDTLDNRPATLDGVIYVTGTATIVDDAVIRGALVAGSVTVNSSKTLVLEYRPYAKDFPPPGFTTGSGVRPLPGSWREVGL
jgi:hypothetical protein